MYTGSQRNCGSLYCDICSFVVVWKWTCNIPGIYLYLYLSCWENKVFPIIVRTLKVYLGLNFSSNYSYRLNYVFKFVCSNPNPSTLWWTLFEITICTEIVKMRYVRMGPNPVQLVSYEKGKFGGWYRVRMPCEHEDNLLQVKERSLE